MSIEEKVLKKLDFDKVLAKLIEYCLLPRAKEMAESLMPWTDREIIRRVLEETDEGKLLLRGNPAFSVRGAKELRPLLERSMRGGVLNPEELLHVRDTLRVARQIIQYFQEEKKDYPNLKEIMLMILPDKAMESEISRCISEEGAVSDQASTQLMELRKSKNRLQQRVRESLEGILRNPSYSKMLQDPIITQRSERYVVPIKQEYRSFFPGIVHDQSASGATLFIEPMPVVHLGNELREVVVKEQREIQRILLQLSSAVANKAEQLADLHEGLAKLDFVLAKAQLSNAMNAGKPHLTDTQTVKLVRARHPLLKGFVVPLTIEIGKEFDTLVITGPNTGGKTVALKTMGLLVAMAQSGLHIPAESESALGLFTQIFVDIGDEQSVEQSLSTFSGHMKNIVHIVEGAGSQSLILLDEVGAGTDPTEGAALAMAILSELHERGCRIVATTHYGALKTFAYETPRVENASVEFDVETLRPTYRLLIGIPGKSNAFNIAGRLGLNSKILGKAKNYLSEREMQVADLIENLEDTQREIEGEKRRVENERLNAERTHKELQRKSLQLDEEYQKMMAKARDEATELLREAKLKAETLINELKEELKKERKEQQAIEKARQGLKGLSNQLEKNTNSTAKAGGLDKKQIKLGQMVYMTKLRQKGQILQLPNDNDEVLVQAGVMKVSIPLSELRSIAEEAKAKPRNSGEGKLGRNKAEAMRSEIDVRGMLVEEATYTIDKYLDDAVLSGINQVYVIHGKGTGALRSGIQDFLRGHSHVKSFRLGQHGEGDLGVTVIELK